MQHSNYLYVPEVKKQGKWFRRRFSRGFLKKEDRAGFIDGPLSKKDLPLAPKKEEEFVYTPPKKWEDLF